MDHSTFQLRSLRPKAQSYSILSDEFPHNETVHGTLPGSQDSSDHHNPPTYNSENFLNPRGDTTLAIGHPAVIHAAPWLPGAFKHFPWLGLSALGVSVICMAVSIGILIRSNGQLVSDWPVQPTVFLAVTSAIANVALRLALARGLSVAWWYKSMRGGTMADLHRYWNFGDSLWASITAGRHFNFLAWASVVVSMTVFDGPLLQRASTIVSKQVIIPSLTNVSIAQQLPVGYTSSILGRLYAPAVLTVPFATVIQKYQIRAPITLDGVCEGTCPTNIQGAGFSVDCSTPNITQPIDYNPISDAGGPGIDIGVATPLFSVKVEWLDPIGQTYPGETDGFSNNSLPERLKVRVSYPDTTGCVGILTTQTCVLTEATVDYSISLINSTATLDLTSHPRVVALGNSSAGIALNSDPGANLTLGGFALVGADLFGSNVSIAFAGAVGYEVDGFNTFASQYVTNPSYVGCQYYFNNPMTDILAALHEIMFRTALYSSHVDASVFIQNEEGNYTFHNLQPVSASQTFSQNVFQSHYRYLGGAIALIALGVLSALPTYYGWWLLGRTMTLSPIEIAKAFNAPMLETTEEPAYSNASVRHLLKRLGTRRVRYGEVNIAQEAGNGYRGRGDAIVGTRLEMAKPEAVSRPRKGAVFQWCEK